MTLPDHLVSRIPTTSSKPKRTTLAIALLLGFAGALAFTGAARAADLARADKNFLEKAAESNMTEINASKIALDKATLPAVKEYANSMITDHGKASDELRALANAKGVKVPEDPSTMQKAKITMLSKLNGNNFDRQYANIVGVNAHEATIKLFRKASTGAKDADVKAFATKMLPSLEHHLQMAKALKTTTDTAGDTRARNAGAMTGTNTATMPAPGTNANTGSGATGAMTGGAGMGGNTASGSAHDGASTGARKAATTHGASGAAGAATTTTTTTASTTKAK